MTTEQIIPEIRRRARQAGLSMSALCVRCGMFPQAHSRWHKNSPKLSTLARLEAELAIIEGERDARPSDDKDR